MVAQQAAFLYVLRRTGDVRCEQGTKHFSQIVGRRMMANGGTNDKLAAQSGTAVERR